MFVEGPRPFTSSVASLGWDTPHSQPAGHPTPTPGEKVNDDLPKKTRCQVGAGPEPGLQVNRKGWALSTKRMLNERWWLSEKPVGPQETRPSYLSTWHGFCRALPSCSQGCSPPRAEVRAGNVGLSARPGGFHFASASVDAKLPARPTRLCGAGAAAPCWLAPAALATLLPARGALSQNTPQAFPPQGLCTCCFPCINAPHHSAIFQRAENVEAPSGPS